MNQMLPSTTESIRPQTSRAQSYERRGRSTSVRPSHNQHEQPQQQQIAMDQMYQFRPPEVVKNIQKAPANTRPNTNFEKSRSRETSTVRKDLLSNLENSDMRRSSSVTSLNYRPSSRLHSNLNPNPPTSGAHNYRYRNPMSAYSSNEAVDTIVPNHSNILYQKYQRPSIASKPSSESKTSVHSHYQTPRSNVSVSMDQELVPAFNDLTMELGEAMNDHIEKKSDPSVAFDVDNRYVHSNSNSTKSNENSENSSLLNGLSTSPEEPIFKSSLSEDLEEQKKLEQEQIIPKSIEKFGRIQQRVNFLKQMKDEESNSTWKSLSVEQKMFFESLNNDLRNLKRSNHRPLHDSLERTNNMQDKQVLDSSASVTSTQYLLKTYNPLKEGRHYSSPKDQQNSKNSKEIDLNKIRSLVSQSSKIAEAIWKTEEEHRPSQITLKSENKSSTDTAVSSINSDALSVKLVTHTYEPKDLDAIKESFDGYEINTASHNDPGNAAANRGNESKQASPLTQRV